MNSRESSENKLDKEEVEEGGGEMAKNRRKPNWILVFSVSLRLLQPLNLHIPTMSFSSSGHPDDLSLSSLSFTVTRGRVKDERLEQSAKEVQQWIETLIGEPIGKGGSGSGPGSGVEELMEALKSGVVLCKVANLVKPGVIASKKIKVPSPAAAAAAAGAAAAASFMSSSAFGSMDNVTEFRNACKLIGVKEQVSSSSSSFFLTLCFFRS